MTKKTRVFKSETLALPPIKMVLGDIPSPDPQRRKPAGQPPEEMRKAVHKLIGYLKSEEGHGGYF